MKRSLPVQQVKVADEVLFSLMEVSLTPPSKPRIELFDEEYISKTLENFALSPTTLNSYLDCPIRFYFEQILPLPAAQNDFNGPLDSVFMNHYASCLIR